MKDYFYDFGAGFCPQGKRKDCKALIYVTGDMHGDESRLYERPIRKLREGDVLIICGDFGFVWDGSTREKKILDYLGSRKYTVAFLDGTHENFDLLNQYRVTVWKGGRVRRISGNLFHLMRGQIYDIGGIKLFVFGGGESSDKEMRSDNASWWRSELPSPAELEEGIRNLEEAGGEVDFILTHEPPSLVKSSMLLRSGQIDRVNKLNGFFEEINRGCRFKKWYFGCMHEDRVITPVHTAVFRNLHPLEKD